MGNDPGSAMTLTREIRTNRIKRIYSVETSNPGQYTYSTDSGCYDVDMDGFTCTCPSRKHPCKHLIDAFIIYLEGG